MDYIREYRKFVYSYYFGHGLQTSFCIILPSIIGYYTHQFTFGILISIGSLCISSIDTPGPPKERRNGLLVGAGVIFVSAFFMSSYLLGAWVGDIGVLLLIFTLSMAAVYGTRASNVGLAGIYALVLATEQKTSLTSFVDHAVLFLIGALWYAFISLLSYSFRPFRLIQQALSDCIYQTAAYLKTRADFYAEKASGEPNYDKLIEQQAGVNNAQAVVRDLLLKRRVATQESTSKGRSLLMILLEIIDIYEHVTAAHVDVAVLQKMFGGTGILSGYQQIIQALAQDLDEIAAAVATGKSSMPKTNFGYRLKQLETKAHQLRDNMMTRENIAGFGTLRNIRRNISLISKKIANLHRYTRLKEDDAMTQLDLAAFTEHEQYSWDKLKSNLGPHSIYFRHAVRVTVAVLAGILTAPYFPVQRSYWILFTLVVILKPGFSLTKKRNTDRLLGTIAGGLIATLILVLIKPALFLFMILVVCMVITYSFSSINYTISTLSTTIFLLIFFDFLKPGDFSFVKERVADTVIASVIAFASSYFVFPVWEAGAIEPLLVSMIEANEDYFSRVSEAYSGDHFDLNRYKLARKKVYVATANLSSAFQRMLSEPKSKQYNVEAIHQFVVLNYVVSSHVATLASYIDLYSKKYHLPAFDKVRSLAKAHLAGASEILQGMHTQPRLTPGNTLFAGLKTELEDLQNRRLLEIQSGSKEETGVRQRLSELSLITDQFAFILNVSQDILKVSTALSAK